jgi:hypothetical protein
MKLDWKKMLQLAGVGIGVVLVTPFLAGILSKLSFLQMELLGMSLASALGAGIAAIGFSYVINEYT